MPNAEGGALVVFYNVVGHIPHKRAVLQDHQLGMKDIRTHMFMAILHMLLPST